MRMGSKVNQKWNPEAALPSVIQIQRPTSLWYIFRQKPSLCFFEKRHDFIF